MLSHQQIAHSLPDLPRWVEARSLLLQEPCEIYGLQREPELSLVLRDPDTGLLTVIGTPAPEAIQAAAAQNLSQGLSGELVVPQEHAALVASALDGWFRTRAVLHLLPEWQHLPPDSEGEVAFVEKAHLGAFSLPEELRRELELCSGLSPIAASFEAGRPVAFCYAGAITESLWDISIDTLPEFRRQGHASRAVASLVRHLQTLGKQPVWSAVDENPASWRLARKLGFVAVDELALFTPGAMVQGY